MDAGFLTYYYYLLLTTCCSLLTTDYLHLTADELPAYYWAQAFFALFALGFFATRVFINR